MPISNRWRRPRLRLARRFYFSPAAIAQDLTTRTDAQLRALERHHARKGARATTALEQWRHRQVVELARAELSRREVNR
jgi:hypothetical protein